MTLLSSKAAALIFSACLSFRPAAAEGLSCPDTLDMSTVIDSSATLYYATVPSNPAGSGNGIFCGRLEVINGGWVGLGFSQAGLMQGSQAVIGLPNGDVQKYDLSDQTARLMANDKQTLKDTSCGSEDGKIKMSFTKLLIEDGEVPIQVGENTFLHARGDAATVAYHRTRMSFPVNISASAAAVPVTEAPPPAAVEPVAAVVPVAALGCSTEYCENQLTDDYLLRYKINVPTDTTAELCEGCTVSMELIYDGEAWVGIAFSEDDKMIGSEAVIGSPDFAPQKYLLTSQDFTGAGVNPAPDNQQTLTDASVEVVDGQTIMKFTKIMKEAGEIEISTGDNAFLYAYGSNSVLGYHAGRDPFELNLSGSEPVTALGCSTEYCENQLTDDYLLRYKINVPTGTTGDVCEGCTVSMELIYDGEAWVGIAFSEDDKMIGSEAVLGSPDFAIQKYLLTSQDFTGAGVNPAPDNQQTLTDTSIEVVDGQTIMKFTKIMKEAGEIEISTGDNAFLYAYGSNSVLGYHAGRDPFQLNLSGSTDDAPSDAAPSVDVTAAPTLPPAPAAPVASKDCTKDFCENQLQDDYLLRYKINVPSDTTADVCEACTISIELIYDGEGWVSLAFSTDASMIGSEAVIGSPTFGPQKYNLAAKAESGVTPMPDSQQTLTDTSIEFTGGQTIMRFTKIMMEAGEIEVVPGDNSFLWAQGSSNTLGYHKARAAFDLNLSSGTSEEAAPVNKSAWLAHGVMAFLAWGVCVPFAVQSSLLRSLLPKGPIWFKLHRGLNSTAYALFITAFAVAVALTTQEKGVHFGVSHQQMGLAMFIMAFAQVSGGFFRPHVPAPDSGEEKTPVRKGWEVGHRVLGVTLLACGFWQMSSGISLFSGKYNASESAEASVTMAYWVWIGLMAAIIVVGGGYFKTRPSA